MEEVQTLDEDSKSDVSDEEMIDNERSSKQVQRKPNTDSSDSDDEAEQNLQLQTLESELANNPSNYEAHVQYIKVLRKMGDIEKLRQAREAMSAIFPLTPAMWQEWAKDEASLSTGHEAFLAIEKLYERGVFDYLYVPLWCDYLNFVQDHDPSVRACSPPGISKARNLFERALTAAGLHFVEGNRIWEEYIEFEQAICGAIDKTNTEAKEKQVQRVRSIFHRHLSVPLSPLKSTLLGYKAWEVEQGNVLDVESSDMDGISSHVASAYKKALEMYNARVHFEEQISRQDISDADRLHEYMIYLKFEQSSGNPARVQVLYERSISDFPISSDIWLDYTRYLDRTLKVVSSIAKDVYSRATKSCLWVGDLWVRYLLSLEHGHASEREIAAVFEKSLQCTFSTLDEYLELYLTRVDGLRRRISSAGGQEVLDYSLIRQTFQQASDYLSSSMQNTNGLLRLHAYWARLEVKLGKDLVAACGVWESFLKNCGSMLEAWQGYIAMETELGHINEARSVYKRCYSKRFSGTGSEEICHSWLQFEREFGMLEDFDRAIEKVTPRLEELQSYRLQQESRSTDQRENTVNKAAHEKRKASSNITDEESPAKRQKGSAQNPKNTHGKDKARAVKSSEEKKPEEIQAKVDKPESANENVKGSSIEKPIVYRDQCTAYISNLNLQANEEHLRDFFSDVGGVVAIRIPQDKLTKTFRGFAYMDFSDDAHLTAAVAKNKKALLGKKMSIARSQPKQRQKEFGGRSVPIQHDASDQAGASGKSASNESTHKGGGDTVQFKGKNTFAMPRTVRPLGWKANKPETKEEGDEKPKSNDEFRKMFIKG